MALTIDVIRAAWVRAAVVPADKERVYPAHAAAQEFDRHRGKRVLEYGCGGGSDAMSYLRRGNAVVLADVVPENITTANVRIERAGLRAAAQSVLLDDSAPLPFPDASFDIVNAHGVLHHIEDPQPVIQEFARVLVPGGLAYMMLYTEHLYRNRRRDVERLMASGLSNAAAFAQCTDGEGAPYATWYTMRSGRALIQQCGLRVIVARRYNSDFFRTFVAERGI